jgi:hypothetical protein
MTLGEALLWVVVAFAVLLAGLTIYSTREERRIATEACWNRGGVLVRGAAERWVCVAGR